MFHQEFCLYHGTNHKVDEEDKTVYLDYKQSGNLGSNQTKICGSTNFDTSKLAVRFPCVHKCIFTSNKCNVRQNPIGKYDQPIVYAFKLLNKTKQNYTNIKEEALTMVDAMHKFRHFLLANKFVFYVDHMALIYLVNKP